MPVKTAQRELERIIQDAEERNWARRHLAALSIGGCVVAVISAFSTIAIDRWLIG